MTQTEEQEILLNQIPKRTSGLLNLSVRIGKTKLAIDLLERDNYKKILWVTAEASLRDKTLPEEFKKWNKLKLLKNTTFICYGSLRKYNPLDYDIVILDEYQKCTPVNMIRFLSLVRLPVIIGLSGTHPKNFDKKDLFKTLKLGVMAKLTIDEAVKKELIAPYTIHLVSCELNTAKTISIVNTKHNFNTSEKLNYAYVSKEIEALQRNELPVSKYLAIRRACSIYSYPSKSAKAVQLTKMLGGRTLIFFPRIEFAENSRFPTYHSKTSNVNLSRFIEGKINTLACVSAGSLGTTFRNVDNLIIIQADSNQTGGTTQKLGRALVKQHNYKAQIYILYFKDTVDEIWARKAISAFESANIIETNYNQLKTTK